MGHEHERDPDLLLEGLELEAQLLADLGVQRAERLVEQQYRRAQDQGSGQGDALLLAARELLGPAAGQRPQLDEIERLLHAAADIALGHLLAAQAEGHVVEHVQVREQRVVLEHRVDVAPVRGYLSDVVAVEQDLAGRRPHEPRDHPQRGRLAAARRA